MKGSMMLGVATVAMVGVGFLVGLQIGSGRSSAATVEPELRANDEVRSVYPGKVAPKAIAERLCSALHEIPAQRRASCEGHQNPGFTITAECVRTLSLALAGGAIQLAEPDVLRCEAESIAAHADCSFTKSLGARYVPACDRIIHGGLAVGAVCRSNMECSDGLVCDGVGPTDSGRCANPGQTGSACGVAVDALATYTKHRSSETVHPACDGFCSHHRCSAFLPLAASCEASLQCGPGASCVERRCAKDG